MRVLIIVAILVLIIILGWIFIYGSVEKDTSELIKVLDEMGNDIREGNWEGASDKFRIISNKWTDLRDTWTILLDHHEIDNIDLSMAKAREYISTRDESLSLGELQVLRKLFNIVRENEALTLTNIM